MPSTRNGGNHSSGTGGVQDTPTKDAKEAPKGGDEEESSASEEDSFSCKPNPPP